MGYSIFSHSHVHLVGYKTNGQRRMVLINLQKPFDIKKHKILFKNVLCWIFSNSIAWFLGLSHTSVSNEYEKQILECCKYQLRSSTTIDRVFLAGGVPPLAKTLLIPPPEKISPSRLHSPPIHHHHHYHQIFILRHHQRLTSPTK